MHFANFFLQNSVYRISFLPSPLLVSIFTSFDSCRYHLFFFLILSLNCYFYHFSPFLILLLPSLILLLLLLLSSISQPFTSDQDGKFAFARQPNAMSVNIAVLGKIFDIQSYCCLVMCCFELCMY